MRKEGGRKRRSQSFSLFPPTHMQGTWSARCWLTLQRIRYLFRFLTIRRILAAILVIGSILFIRVSYREIHSTCLLGGEGEWAIGMAFGDSPFHLDFSAVPSLTCQHVVDARDRQFVADPFMIKEIEKEVPSSFLKVDPVELPLPPNSPSYQRIPTKGKWYLFFEILVRTYSDTGDEFKGDKGVIGVAWSDNPLENHWHYQQVVLEEDFHLSYPFVFYHRGEYFMIPETNEAHSIRLYKATFFPHRWEFVKTLIDGEPFIDASPILFKGKWWIFTLLKNHNSPRLLIYFSNTDDLLADDLKWTLHPSCPLYEGNNEYTRPGGRPFIHEGFIYRFSQDLTTPTTYGRSLRVMQVTKLTSTAFAETEITTFLPIEKYAWISKRIHHVDLHPRSELEPELSEAEQKDGPTNEKIPGWFAVVDGNRYFYSPDLTFVIQVVTVLVIDVVLLFLIFYPHKRRILRSAIGFIFARLRQCLSFIQMFLAPFSHASTPSSLVHSILRRKWALLTLVGVVVSILLFFYFIGLELSFFGYPLCAKLQCVPTASFDNSGPIVLHPGSLPPHASHRECPVTVVTALYDIGRGEVKAQEKMQTWDSYLGYFGTVLSVNACYIVHVAPETVDHVLHYRGCKKVGEEPLPIPHSAIGFPTEEGTDQKAKSKQTATRLVLRDCKSPTEIIVGSLADWRDSYPYFDRMAEILKDPKSKLVRRPERVEKIMPEYNLLMFLKMKWLHAASLSNPFDSSYLFWMDGGYGKGWYFNGREFHNKRWPDYYKVRKNVDPHQFFMLNVFGALKGIYKICPKPAEELAKSHTVTIAGGFYGGTVTSIKEFAPEYDKALNDTLTAGIMDDDQSVLSYTYCRRPDLVQLHYCTHKFIPYQMISLESQFLSWGRYHCPVGLFAADL